MMKNPAVLAVIAVTVAVIVYMLFFYKKDEKFIHSTPVHSSTTRLHVEPVPVVEEKAIVKKVNKSLKTKHEMKPTNLLPNQSQKSDFEFAPKDLREMNFMDTKDRIGIDTVSNTLKNANYSIRPDPQIVKTSVSPWMNSEIDADPMRNSRSLL